MADGGLQLQSRTGNDLTRYFPELELPAGNFELLAYKGLLIKDSYWRWPERNLAGNTIDFFAQVLGLSFHDAMSQITGT